MIDIVREKNSMQEYICANGETTSLQYLLIKLRIFIKDFRLSAPSIEDLPTLMLQLKNEERL